MEQDSTIEDFLAKSPLYKKYELDDTFTSPLNWYGIKFQFNCDLEKGERTFKVILEPDELINELELKRKDFQTEDKKLDYVTHISGICQSCGDFKVHFLIHVFSDIPIQMFVHQDKERAYLMNFNGIQSQDYNPKFFIKKLGQLPAVSIKPDKEILDFLEEIDKEYYSKALICLSQSFGIAAYSYFRRIVETEVVRIVEHLIRLDLPNKQIIEEAYNIFISNHQMDSFLVRIDKYLPPELKVIHDSPLRLLYSELSLGIHSYQEELCLQNAETTNELLTAIIRALNTKRKNKELADKLKILGRK